MNKLPMLWNSISTLDI